MINYANMKSPIGEIWVAENCGFIEYLDFKEPKNLNNFIHKQTPTIKKTFTQLDEYFDKKRREFDVPLNFIGTEFQKCVWNALTAIPYGERRSYKDIAIAAGCPKGSRAVGRANNCNPISIIVPCHRVIGFDGQLVGYGGGLHIKQFLLDLENSL